MTTPSGDHRMSGPLPTSVAAAVTLRIAEARVEDIGHAIARLAPTDLGRIDARRFGGEDRSEASMAKFYEWLGKKKKKDARIRLCAEFRARDFFLVVWRQVPLVLVRWAFGGTAMPSTAKALCFHTGTGAPLAAGKDLLSSAGS